MALRIAKASPVSPEQGLHQAEMAFEAGNYARASEILSHTGDEEASPLPFKLLSYALLKQERLEEAILAAVKVIERSPFEGTGFNLLGVILHRFGQYALAEKFFRRVLVLDPDHPEARLSVVDCMQRKTGVIPEAFAPILALLEFEPQGDATTLKGFGIQAYERKLLEQAANCFFRALEQTPEDAELYRYLAMVLMDQEKLDKAMLATAQSIRLAPMEANGFNMMGVILTRLGEGESAKKFFKRTLQLDPQHPTATVSLQSLEKHTFEASETDLSAIEILLELGTPRISLCLIAKNEEKFLAGCLESVQDAVDEIILVDTGSTDRTIEIAEQWGAKVFHFPWCNDFSAARNESIQHATGDWILVLDADERLDRESLEALRRLSWHPKAGGFGLVIDNLLGENETSKQLQTAVILRFFRNLPSMRYEGSIHEQIIPAIQRTGMPQFESKVRIIHLGYLKDTITERDKNHRNLGLLINQAEAEPQNPYTHFNLGQTHRMLGNFQEAERSFRQSLQLLKERHEPLSTPYYLTLYLNLALLYHEHKHYEQALEVCRESIPLYPDYPDLHFVKGLSLMEFGRFQEAIQAMSSALIGQGKVFAAGSDPGASSYKAYQTLGVCYARTGNFAQARHFFQKAVQETPKPLADLHLNLGRIALQEGNFRESLGHFADALEIEPDNSQTLQSASFAYRNLGLLEEAIQTAEQAVLNHPEAPEARLFLSEALLAARRIEESLKVAEEELALHPSAAARQSVGLAKLLLGDRPGCRQLWEGEDRLFLDWLEGKAIEFPAEITPRWLGYAQTLLRTGQAESLARMVQDADRLAQALPKFALGLGQLLLEANLTEWAMSVLLAFREKNPQDPMVFYLLGESCIKEHLIEDARLMLEHALQLNPSLTMARRRLLALPV